MSYPHDPAYIGGEMCFEARDIIRALKEHDVIQISWADGEGMLSGNPFAIQPKIMAVRVPSQKEAWALDAAKRAVGEGDDDAALEVLRTCEVSRAPASH